MKRLLVIASLVAVVLVLALVLVIPALADSPGQQTGLNSGSTAVIPLAQSQGGCGEGVVEEAVEALRVPAIRFIDV